MVVMIDRNRCVIQGMTPKKVMPHDEFMERIRKSLYYGGGTAYADMSVSRPLAEYASELFSEPHKGHSLNRLNKETAGRIHASPCSLIMALIYLDRLNSTDPNYVRRITPSELFIVSMMVSTKFYCGHDEDIELSDWAQEGSMSEEKLKELELEFLCAIEWNIFISNEVFFKKLSTVEKILAHREGLKRGWLTYTELLNFLPSFTIAKFLLNNIAVLAVSYAASVMTIAGAFFIVSNIPGNVLIKRTTDTQVKTTRQLNVTQSHSDILGLTLDSEETRNGTCTAIDIEDELIKLEMQYADTIISSKNNEYSGPLINFNENYLVGSTKIDLDNSINWQNFMDDENCDNNIMNCTKSLFWKLLWNNDKSFIQFSFMWLKFI